tara:strand:- start:998 stop:3820 length:2823 start_codon:yes stop_codon:yes gene_type:complete
MLLGKVFKNINQKYKYIQFKNIRFNSKDCRSNDIFFAIIGNNLNGNNYINNAISNGAKVIVSNLKFEGFNQNKILFIHNKNPRKLLSEVASRFYKLKPKNIIAVTGTNGKTSIANFYYQILTLNNKKVATIGTLGILSKKLNLKTDNTTVDPIKIHKILKKLKEFKIDNVILEASSHGLKQHRLNGINFKTALFTNLSRDHLDYHKTFKDYLNSKLVLFNKLLKNRGNIIFDDKISQAKQLNKISKKRKLKKYSFGADKSFINILNIQKINDHKKVDFSINKKIYSFKTSLIGKVQIKNLMFAIVASYLSKIKINKILKLISKIKPIYGRLEKIGNIKNKSNVILDYAHTPDALKKVILNIRDDYPLSKISLVFGCGGNRDKDKRSIMGSIASKYCDAIYLTDDNPRLENPKLIRNQIKKGIKKNKFNEIPSRAKAIFTAVKELNSGDILIVAGKGHENYQEYKKRKFFSDKNEILKSINKKNLTLSKSIKTNILRESFKKKNINKNLFINSASINSKKVNKNSIFIGVKGKKFDGNLYAGEAIKNRAILAITNKKSKNSKIIFHQNPLKIFSKISSKLRKSLDANNIAITGSAGKTSVKELTGFCLSKLDKTYFSKDSFNNKYGVPISIFNTPQGAKFTVLEVGMDKKGEIDYLTKLIKPHLGLITNISYAHIKNFKNLDQIAKAKSEIINNIIPGGTMIINMDDKYYEYFSNKAKNRKLKIISFSKKNKNANVVFLNQKKIKKKYLINIKINSEIKSFLISKDLLNYKENILACLSIIINYFNIEKLSKNLFLDFNIPKSRGSIINYKKGLKKLTIVDESYNSNPLSFKFALEKFDKTFKEKNKKFLLIGNMLELGKYSKKLHIKIAKYINKAKLNKTYAYGELTKHTFNKLKPQMKGKMLNNTMEILNLINKGLPNKSFLMVKGSNSTGLNKIIQNL